MSLPELLGVDQILERYGLRDRRAARRLMDAVGSFKVAANLYVRVSDLDAYERRAIEARRPSTETAPGETAGASRRKAPTVREPKRPGWWRAVPSDGKLDGPLRGGGV